MENSMNSLMQTTLENIRNMVDVNTIIGDALHLDDGTVILPVSRVAFGFAAGGTGDGSAAAAELAGFGGGTGAGVSVRPVGFLVCSVDGVRFLSTGRSSLSEQLTDYVPQAVELFKDMLSKQPEQSQAENLAD